jgi:hypothetical protein
MKNILGILLVFFSFQNSLAQETSRKITMSFKDSSIETVLKDIEKLTDYTFYYIQDWFEDQSINGDYKNVSVSKILNDIFNQTSVNFYIHNNKSIVLTKNSVIYNELPEGFLVKIEKEETKTEENTLIPVFYDENLQQQEKVLKIGKASKAIKIKTFTLKGRVINELTKRPIQNVAIVVKGKNLGTTTNKKGDYSLSIPLGMNLLEISAIGNEKVNKSVLIYNNGKLNIELKEIYETLDEVVVRANRDVNVVKTITGMVQINPGKIKTIPLVLGELDILKVATTLPGISTAGEGSSGYHVRGGKADQNLILLDNTVIYNPTHFFGIFTGLNPFTSSSVNIYKGSIPVEFGGRLSSVFDISTKDGNTQKFSGEASIGPVMSNLAVEIPVVKGKSSLLIGVRSTYSDWILKLLDSESLKNSGASFYDLVTKYYHKINAKNSVRVTGYLSKDNFRVTSDSLYSYSNKLVSINWEHKLNKKNRVNVILGNSYYGFKINFEKENYGGFNLGYNINETELKLKFKYLRSETHKFDYGVSTKMYTVNPGNINPVGQNSTYTKIDIPKEKALESAIFISDNIKINEKLQLDLGLRYSSFLSLGPSTQRIYSEGVPKSIGTLEKEVQYGDNDLIKSYGGLEARMSARYFLAEDFSVKASYNKNNQYIHTLSNNTTASPTDTWKLSDLNIKPQFSEQFSVGLYRNLNDNMYEISIEGYYKKLKNILDYKTGAKLLLNKTIETKVLQGEGKSYGIEFLVKKTTGKLNGWFGYTYSRSLNKFESIFASETINNGNYFSSNYDKPNDFSLVLNYKLTKRYSLSLNGVYQTGRPVTFPTAKYTYNNVQFVTYSDRNKFRIPDYYRIDLSLNIEGNHKIKKFAHSFWNISIYNVLGRNNPYSVFFISEDSGIKAYQSSIFSKAIPTITYNFKF